MTRSVEEEYLSAQLDYFETLRQQLIQQQQQELQQLMVEQQKQQMLFQQEILRQGQPLLQGIQTGTLPVRSTHQSLPQGVPMYPGLPSAQLDASWVSDAHSLPAYPPGQLYSDPSLAGPQPWILNPYLSSQLTNSDEEQLLAQLFNDSQSTTSQRGKSQGKKAKKSGDVPGKGKPQGGHPALQKVSFSVDTENPSSTHRSLAPGYASQDTMNDIRNFSSMNSSLNQSLNISAVAGVYVPDFPRDGEFASPGHGEALPGPRGSGSAGTTPPPRGTTPLSVARKKASPSSGSRHSSSKRGSPGHAQHPHIAQAVSNPLGHIQV